MDELKARMLGHIANNDWYKEAISPETVVSLIERLERAEADIRRLDSGVIMTDERDDFGEEYKCERRGLDLRAMIDEAIEAGRKDADN